MAIIQAQAKLYQGLRCYVVDKNISAALTGTFSLGHKRRDVEGNIVLDDNGYAVIDANVLGFKIVRTIADLLCPRPKPTLINERYKTYGGGNNVINANGSIDNTNNSKIISTLKCVFPTYFRLDFETLGIPEGQDCIVMLEEGFVIEDKGLTATNKAMYPQILQSPSPRNDLFATFRTPKTFGKRTFASIFSLYNLYGRIRPFSINISSAMSFVSKITYQRAGAISLTGGSFAILPTAVKRASGVIPMYASFGPNNVGGMPELAKPNRLRPSAVSTNEIIATLNQPSTNGRIRKGQLEMPTASFIAASGDRTMGPISASITSTSSLTMNIGIIKGIIETTPVVSIMTTLPNKTTRIQEALVSTATTAVEGKVPMVFEWDITTTDPTSGIPTKTGFIPIYFGNINAKIDWGDGTTSTITSLSPYVPYAVGGQGANNGISHTYANVGTYRVTIEGYIQSWGFTNPSQWADSRDWVRYQYWNTRVRLQTWGDVGFETLVGAFQTGAYYSGSPNTDVPYRLPSTVKDVSYMFYNFNISYPEVPLPPQIANWDVSNVENMEQMFRGCKNWDPDLGTWNVSKVTNFKGMFLNATSFTGKGLQNWNPSSAILLDSMFYGTSFNNSLPNWDLSNATSLTWMFAYVPLSYPSNQLHNWDLSSATKSSLTGMFWGAKQLDLSSWCVPNVSGLPDSFWYQYDYSYVLVPPDWGTCPGDRPVISSVTMDDTVVNEGQTITMTVNVSNPANTIVYYRLNMDYPSWEYANNSSPSPADQWGVTRWDDVGIFTGYITIINGVGTLSIPIPNNPEYGYPEVTEYFRVDLLSRNVYITPNSKNPALLGQSPIVTILP